MTHPFLTQMAHGLFDRGIGTLRYQFQYMEKGSKRPDVPAVARAAVRAAAAARLVASASAHDDRAAQGEREKGKVHSHRGHPGVRLSLFAPV